MKLLIVEDSELIAQRLCAAFSAIPALDIATAAGFVAAAAILDAWQPQVVILDIQLPDGSGLDLLHRIKEGARPLTQVLMFSNHAYLRQRCEKEGADAFFDKGMEFEALAGSVRKLAGGAA